MKQLLDVQFYKSIFDAQFYVIFVISIVLLFFAARWLRYVISGDLGEVVFKQYQKMFDKIDEQLESNRELNMRVKKLEDKVEGLETKAFSNKDGIARIEKKLDEIKSRQ